MSLLRTCDILRQHPRTTLSSTQRSYWVRDSECARAIKGGDCKHRL